MDVSGLRIIADERERKSGIPVLLEKIGVRTDVVTLKTGDYIVASETAVERKSVRDLVSSVADGRLYDQCARLRDEFKRPVMILEGGSEEIARAIDNPFVFYAAVSRVAVDFGVSLIQTPDATHTAKLLVSLGAREGACAGARPKRTRRKAGAGLRDQQIGILCGLPGVGERLATRLLERFGTPQKVFTATHSELTQVEGFGEQSTKRLRDVLRTKEGAKGRAATPSRGAASRRSRTRRTAAPARRRGRTRGSSAPSA